MSDPLVSLSPTARKIIGTLGLPLPLPVRLAREAGPWTERELADRAIVVGGHAPELLQVIADTLAEAGADPSPTEVDGAAFRTAGEAWGRPPVPVPDKPWGLVFDATGIADPSHLKSLYSFFSARIRTVATSGRIVVLGRPHDETSDLAEAASRRALDGFVRSLAKEAGRRGVTANLVTVATGADERVGPILRFLLSPRSAFLDGQPIHVTKRVAPSKFRPVRPLDGKIALVTGAARGIGAATARALAREGAKVIVVDRPQDDGPASAIAAEVHGATILADLGDPASAELIAKQVAERFGGVDIVVHNAGITRDKTLANMPPETWDAAIDVNLSAVLRLHAALEPQIRKEGRVVCLSSIAGLAGNVGQTNYAASKAGIVGLVETLGPKLAKKGIAVNAVAPGFIETRLTAAIPVATREVARRLAALSQGGLPEDIAEVITFLASPGANGLCGQTVRVCGGSFVGA